jgi:hypothetical protein
MMKHEYHEGPQALKNFDKGMTKLFKVPKESIKEEKPKPVRKRETTSRD